MVTRVDLEPPLLQLREPGFLLARSGPVLVFFRWGTIDAAGIEMVGSVARAVRASRSGPVGGLVLVEGDAPEIDAAANAAQRRVFRELVSGDRTRIAGVVEGDSVVAQLRRSGARLFTRFVIGRGLSFHASVREAAGELGAHLGVDPAQIERLAEEVRALRLPLA